MGGTFDSLSRDARPPAADSTAQIPTPERVWAELVQLCAVGMGFDSQMSLPHRQFQEDLPAVFDLSQRHGVTGLAYEGCERMGYAKAMDPHLIRQSAISLLLTGARQKQHGLAIAESTDALESAGIRSVVLKGLATAHMCYSDPALRPSGDIDLLVDVDNKERAIAALLNIGYEVRADPVPTSHILAFYYAISLIRDGITIDLHWDLLNWGREIPESPTIEIAERMLNRRALRKLGEAEACVLTPGDALLSSCLHLFAHRGERRLLWLCDTAALARHLRPNQWSGIRGELARSGRMEVLGTAVRTTLAQACRDFGIPTGLKFCKGLPCSRALQDLFVWRPDLHPRHNFDR